MTSVLTNTRAMIALQSFEAARMALDNTQNEISVGRKISKAKDNAAFWTVTTTMKANISSLNQVSTSLGKPDSILGIAVTGTNESLMSQSAHRPSR